MLRQTLASIAIALSFLPSLAGTAGAQVTIAEGTIFFRDSSGSFKAYPWPVDDTEIGLTVTILSKGVRVKPDGGMKLERLESVGLGVIISFETRIGNKTELPTTLHVKFNWGRFGGEATQEIKTLGEVMEPLRLEVTESFQTEAEQKDFIQSISQRIASASPSDEIKRTYTQLKGYIAKRNDLNSYLLLVQLIQNVVEIQSKADLQVAVWPKELVWDLSNLASDSSFRKLTPADQFRVLSDIASVLGRSANPKFSLDGSLRILDLAGQLYGSAMNLAKDTNSDLNESSVARNLQGAYQFFCNLQDVPEFRLDCFLNIFDILSLSKEFDSKSTRVFLGDYVYYLTQFSEMDGLVVGTDEWFQVVSGRDDIKEPWLLLAELEEIGSNKTKALLRSNGEFRNSLAIAKEVAKQLDMTQ